MLGMGTSGSSIGIATDFLPLPFLCSSFFCSTSRSPNLSTNESTLVRSLIMVGLNRLGEGLAHGVACSLCCQQKASGLEALRCGLGLGEAFGVFAIPRRQGRPFDVRPLHVAAGFLESLRASRDSGVCGICILLISAVIFLVGKFGTNLEAENIYMVLLFIASVSLIGISRTYECFMASDSWSVDI